MAADQLRTAAEAEGVCPLMAAEAPSLGRSYSVSRVALHKGWLEGVGK